MAAIAAGMESDDSDLESDSDMVFPTKSDAFAEKKQHKINFNNSCNKTSSANNPQEPSFRPNKEKTDRQPMVPSTVMRKNYNSRNVQIRQRVHRNRTLVFDDLRFAIQQGSLEDTKNLYESNGINVDTILKSGWTGLMFACSIGHADITEYLLQRKADPNFHHDMFTPLMAVCISKKEEENLLKCCLLLLEHGANVNVHDRMHLTPLIFAAREGHAKIVRVLLDHKADSDDSDNRGYTALAWAAYFGHGQVIRILLEKGADSKKTNNMGQRPADIAYDQGHAEVASVLEKVLSLSKEESLGELSSLPVNTKKTMDSFVKRHSQSSKTYSKYGELDVFLIGIGCQELLEKFNEHHLSFQDLLIMDDADLEKIGIFQVGLRKKILESCKAVHKADWQNSSVPNLKRNNFISCPDAVSMIANISKHMRYISTSVVYIRKQIQSQPRILEISKDAANIHNLMDEIEDSLKNLQSLKEEMRFLKMHLIKIQNKPEYINGDLIVETISENQYTKTLIASIGITTVSIVLAGIWWKYPGILNSLQPTLYIRIPFLK